MDDIEDQVRLFQPVASASGTTEETSLQSSHTVYAAPAQTTTVGTRFPYSLVMKVTASEPRDVLQLERTCLTFIRFSTTLFFTALGIILNFRLDTTGSSHEPNKGPLNMSKYSTVVSFLLLVLSLCTLVICGINYFVTIQRYAQHKIYTYSYNNLTSVVTVSSVTIVLMGICITLIVEGYMELS